MTIALAAAVLKQTMTPPQLVGAGLVAAIVGTQLRRRPKLRLVPSPAGLPFLLKPAEPLAA